MPSPETATLEIRTHYEDPYVSVQLLDANLYPLSLPEVSDEGSLQVQLPLGLYEVQFRSGEVVQSVFTALKTPNTKETVTQERPLERASAAPLNGTSNSHEYHQGPAQRLSNASPVSITDDVDSLLLLFVRDPQDRAPGHRGRGVSVRTLDCQELFDLEEQGEHREDDCWAGAHLGLKAGTYLLRVAPPRGVAWEVPIVTRPGFQTQVFLSCRDGVGDDGRYADLESMSLLMSSDTERYQPWAADFTRTDAALSALEGGERAAGDLRSALLQGKFANPMLGIYGAHLLLRMNVKRREELLVTVLTNLRRMLGRHPDVEALRLGFELRLGHDPFGAEWPVEPLRTIPMLHRSWKRWVEATEQRPELIGAGSLADRVSSQATSAGPWLAWASSADILFGDTPGPDPIATLSATLWGPNTDMQTTLGGIQDLLTAQPALFERTKKRQGLSALQQRIAYTVAPELDEGNRLLTALTSASNMATKQATAFDVTHRFRVPRGTAERAAWALLGSLRSERDLLASQGVGNETIS